MIHYITAGSPHSFGHLLPRQIRKGIASMLFLDTMFWKDSRVRGSACLLLQHGLALVFFAWLPNPLGSQSYKHKSHHSAS